MLRWKLPDEGRRKGLPQEGTAGAPAVSSPGLDGAGGVSQLRVINRQLDAPRSSLLPFLPGAPKRGFPPSKSPGPATVTFLHDIV